MLSQRFKSDTYTSHRDSVIEFVTRYTDDTLASLFLIKLAARARPAHRWLALVKQMEVFVARPMDRTVRSSGL